jgi:hypothetical protein
MLDDQDEFEKRTPAELMHELLHAVERRRRAFTVLADVYTNLVVPHPNNTGVDSPPVVE